jgi:hypothetical protein
MKNVVKNKSDKIYLRIGITVGLVIVIFLFTLFAYKAHVDYKIETSPLTTQGVIYRTISTTEGLDVEYVYELKGKEYKQVMPIPNSFWGAMYHPTPGEKYLVRYAEDQPTWSKIFLDKPIH